MTMGLEAYSPPYLIHVGCDTMRFSGFVNIDARVTPATDLVHDCKDLSVIPDGSAEGVFAHAFLEHLPRDERVPFLADVHRVLRSDGWVFIMGIPDFEMIATAYLARSPGNISPTFDLFEVYRYTHGHPEHQSDWWHEQLHKSLFDRRELREILVRAGFMAPSIIRYAFRGEPQPVNLGFIAHAGNRPVADSLLESVHRFFSPVYGTNPFHVV